jgi:hypothetical protein
VSASGALVLSGGGLTAGGSSDPGAGVVEATNYLKLRSQTIYNVTTNNATLTSGRVQVGDGGRGVQNATASGAVPINADGSTTTFPQVNALAGADLITNNWATGNSSILLSNNVLINATHTLSLSNATANTILKAGSDNTVSSIANGGTTTFLEGTTPPAFVIPPYVLKLDGAAGNPSTSSTYHYGASAAINFITASATHPQYVQVRIPKTGHITQVATHWFVGGTLQGNGNTTSLWVTNITATTSQSLTAVAWNVIESDIVDSALSFAVTAGDEICIRMTTPSSFGTSPTSIVPSAILYIEK